MTLVGPKDNPPTFPTPWEVDEDLIRDSDGNRIAEFESMTGTHEEDKELAQIVVGLVNKEYGHKLRLSSEF